MLIRFGKRKMSVGKVFHVLLAISGVMFVSYTKGFSEPRHGAVAGSTEANTQDSLVRIVGHATADGWALSFLEKLTDLIGPRVTGSQQSQEASQLVAKALTSMGFESAHFEEYSFHPAWQRGSALARIISPVDQALVVGSYGWVPGTPDRIQVPVADIGRPPGNDLPASPETLRGKVVLVDVHDIGNSPLPVMRALIAQQLARAGAAAMLIPSDKPDHLLYTSAWGFYPRGPLPVLSIGKEDTLTLRRLLTKGNVAISLDVQNSFGTSTATERNVIAELPGTDADEMVLLGAHLDSWDYAQGADDNGSGVAAVLDTARILKSLNIKPKCTIRFVLFTGEEQANLGSRAYIEKHKQELDRLRTFLMMDDGAQPAIGLQSNTRDDFVAPLQDLLRPLVPMGAGKIYVAPSVDSDDASFMIAGVPSLSLKVEPGDYDIRHHPSTDTFDKIDPRALALDTSVLAATAWMIANAPERPGRRLSAQEVQELLKKNGLELARETILGPTEP